MWCAHLASALCVAQLGAQTTTALAPFNPTLARETFEVVAITVTEHYFDPTLRGLNWPALVAAHRSALGQQRDAATFHAWINTLLAKLNDSHTQLVPAATLLGQPEALPSTFGEFGARLAVFENTVFVDAVIQNSVAANASFQPGDEIVSINGQTAYALYQSQLALESPAAPEARRHARALAHFTRTAFSSPPPALRVRRAGGFVDLRAPRSSAPATQRIAESEPVNIDIAQLTLRQFQSEALPVLSGYFDEKWSRGLLIDLRGNEGGDLAVVEAMTARLFAQNVTLATEQFRDGKSARERPWIVRGAGAAARDEPLALLVDERCASACELFTAALKENGRARVFGHATPGIVAGVASKPMRLPDGSGLQISRVGFLSPQGRALDNVGVMPDETCVRTQADAVAGEDCVRKLAIRWLSGQIAY